MSVKACRAGGNQACRKVRMPWSSSYFPASMRRLSPVVRERAIEIANTLLAEGMEESKAVRIAIAKAKEWAPHHGLAD
jgi:uncharacterized protein YdaT